MILDQDQKTQRPVSKNDRTRDAIDLLSVLLGPGILSLI